MQNSEKIAKQIFDSSSHTPCGCGGGHKICLSCVKCRAKDPDQTKIDYTQINQYIDHTCLKPEATFDDIIKLLRGGEFYAFKAICVNPYFIDHIKINRVFTYPLICTVVGFPLGATSEAVKVYETKNAIKHGAKEIDMVINHAMLHEKFYSDVSQEINSIYQVCQKKNVTLKVIIETCILTPEEIITASLIAKQAGADFVKTSTGFTTAGADIESVKLIRTVVGPKMGVKASGGIKTLETAIAMLKAGANRIGTSNAIQIVGDDDRR